jgi:hypothetical protein
VLLSGELLSTVAALIFVATSQTKSAPVLSTAANARQAQVNKQALRQLRFRANPKSHTDGVDEKTKGQTV